MRKGREGGLEDGRRGERIESLRGTDRGREEEGERGEREGEREREKVT